MMLRHALFSEFLKLRRTKITWIVALLYCFGPMSLGFFMIILKEPEFARAKKRKMPVPQQLLLFADRPNPVVEELKQIDIDSLSPIEALMKLKELKDKAR